MILKIMIFNETAMVNRTLGFKIFLLYFGHEELLFSVIIEQLLYKLTRIFRIFLVAKLRVRIDTSSIQKVNRV